MSQEQNADKKTSAENFADIFKSFGQVMSEIFNDPEFVFKALGLNVDSEQKAIFERLPTALTSV